MPSGKRCGLLAVGPVSGGSCKANAVRSSPAARGRYRGLCCRVGAALSGGGVRACSIGGLVAASLHLLRGNGCLKTRPVLFLFARRVAVVMEDY